MRKPYYYGNESETVLELDGKYYLVQSDDLGEREYEELSKLPEGMESLDPQLCVDIEIPDDLKIWVDADSLGLQDYGRVEIDGVEWVCYYDGAYRHVVTADSYDKRYDMSFDEAPDRYTIWCDEVDFAEDEIAKQVGAKLDLEYVNSAGGTCSYLDCFE